MKTVFNYQGQNPDIQIKSIICTLMSHCLNSHSHSVRWGTGIILLQVLDENKKTWKCGGSCLGLFPCCSRTCSQTLRTWGWRPLFTFLCPFESSPPLPPQPESPRGRFPNLHSQFWQFPKAMLYNWLSTTFTQKFSSSLEIYQYIWKQFPFLKSVTANSTAILLFSN